MILNINVGFLGHVDSGKTTIVKKISAFGSTAAFDKSPQSFDRKITLDLGFSGLLLDEVPESIKKVDPRYEKLNFTFVDCPGE